MTQMESWLEHRRELPIALAHVMANTRPTNQERQTILNRLFGGLSLPHQILCRAELAECREARRARRVAVIK